MFLTSLKFLKYVFISLYCSKKAFKSTFYCCNWNIAMFSSFKEFPKVCKWNLQPLTLILWLPVISCLGTKVRYFSKFYSVPPSSDLLSPFCSHFLLASLPHLAILTDVPGPPSPPTLKTFFLASDETFPSALCLTSFEYGHPTLYIAFLYLI